MYLGHCLSQILLKSFFVCKKKPVIGVGIADGKLTAVKFSSYLLDLLKQSFFLGSLDLQFLADYLHLLSHLLHCLLVGVV